MMNDLDVFIKTLFLEAGSSCGIDDVLAVAWVIRNRVEAGYFGKGYTGVCLKPSQFSCWNSTRPEKITISPKDRRWRMCIDVANYVMAAPAIFNPLPAVTHYFNPVLCWPDWVKNMTQIHYNLQLNHIFFK